MNASRLKEIIDLLLRSETSFRIQSILGEANSNLANMAQQPQQPQFQTAFAQALSNLKTATENMRKEFKPAQGKLFEEIGASPFFADDIAENISTWARENAATPMVAHQKLQEFFNQRQQFLEKLIQTKAGLDSLGIKIDELKSGDAEIGFLVPRELFDNHLAQLIKELGTINRIIRAFSEAAIGSAEPVEVHQISTSDPLFFFGINPITIAAIASAVTWALDTWKRVEDIRAVRASTAKLKDFKDDEIATIFDSKIKETIKLAIAEQTKKLLVTTPENKGRIHEQTTDINWALESILARVERGMTVEVRLIPPPPVAATEGQPPTVAPEFQQLQELIPQLVFPKPQGKPVLELPPAEPKSDR